MRTRGAVLRSVPGKFEVVELEVDDPRQNELRVKMTASGLCHSDDHVASGAVGVPILPMCGGREVPAWSRLLGPTRPGGRWVTTSCFVPACLWQMSMVRIGHAKPLRPWCHTARGVAV
jgi:D-arabinose 1-dehydrogenase-like Zn-dependent alcohol dehydrogenase